MNIAVNENDVRKTLIDAIPRIFSWIMLFKNMEVRQNSSCSVLKHYLLFWNGSISFAVAKCNLHVKRSYGLFHLF